MVWYLPFLLCDLSFGGLCVGLRSILDSCLHLGANCNPVSFVYMRLSSFQPRGLESLSLLRVSGSFVRACLPTHIVWGSKEEPLLAALPCPVQRVTHLCSHSELCMLSVCSQQFPEEAAGRWTRPVHIGLQRGRRIRVHELCRGQRYSFRSVPGHQPLPRPACQGLCQGSLCWLLCTSFWGRRRLEKVRV